MISKTCAEFLNLPPETSPVEAREQGVRMREALRQQIVESAPGSDIATLERQLAAAEQVLNELEAATPVLPTAVPEHYRAALDLDEDATADQALAKAEARLKETTEAQSALKPKHPAHPRLKRDRERFETIVA